MLIPYQVFIFHCYLLWAKSFCQFLVAVLILKTDVIVSGKDPLGAGVQLLYFAPGMVRIEQLI
jgi:hypothetical protein